MFLDGMTPEQKIAHLFADQPLDPPHLSDAACAVYLEVRKRIDDPEYIRCLQRADKERSALGSIQKLPYMQKKLALAKLAAQDEEED